MAIMDFARAVPLTLMLFLAFETAARAETPVVVTGKPVSVEEVVRRAVEVSERRRQARLTFECDQIITTERLDEAGRVFKTKTVRAIHREGRDAASSGNSDPVDGTGNGSHRDGDTVKAQHLLATINLRRLVPRFRYDLAKEESVRGRICFVVAFGPLGGHSAATQEDKVIDNLRGKFWVDRDTSEILQGEGSLASPVRVGLIAFVTRMDFRFHTQTLPGGETLPSDFETDLVFEAPLYFYHQRQTSRLENWRVR